MNSGARILLFALATASCSSCPGLAPLMWGILWARTPQHELQVTDNASGVGAEEADLDSAFAAVGHYNKLCPFFIHRGCLLLAIIFLLSRNTKETVVTFKLFLFLAEIVRMAQGNGQNGATPPKVLEVAIVGGGIAGLTLAIALHHRRVPVKIYERAPQFGEIGAGVSFSPNAIRAMRHCHPGIQEAFEKVCTRNGWPSKQKVWFDYIDGTNDESQESAFSIHTALGQNGVHRAHFLDELVKLFPSERAFFAKEILDINEGADGKMVMTFADGSEASADAVIGCDGIKSRVREIVVGSSHPSVYPTYTHKYAYRGMLSMEKAVEALGEERARNSCMYVSIAFTAGSSNTRNANGSPDGARRPCLNLPSFPWRQA